MASYDPLTDRQFWILYKILPDEPPEKIRNMTRGEASDHIRWYSAHWRGYSPTGRQETFLRNWGQWQDGLNRGQACDRIAAIKARTAGLTPDELDQERDRSVREALGHAWPTGGPHRPP